MGLTALWFFAGASLLVAFTTAFFITPITARLATSLGLLDRPDPESYKLHALATPYLGGIAIFCGLVLGSGVFIALPAARSLALVSPIAIAIGLALLIGFVGLIDDIKPLPRSVRLAAQIAVSLGAWEVGFRVSATRIGWLDLALTVLWIVGITNAFNLMDNMDGLTAGLAAVSALSFSVIGLTAHQPALAITSSALAGAAFGFLAHNKHPANIFMGDAGAVFLGYLLALIGIRLRFENLVEATFLVPVVVLGLPIFDTTLVVLGRLIHGRRPFTGASDHLSHRLRTIGLPVRATVWILYWSALCLGWLGLTISRSSTQVAWMLLGFLVGLGLFFGALLLRIPIYGPGARRKIRRRTRTDAPTTRTGPSR